MGGGLLGGYFYVMGAAQETAGAYLQAGLAGDGAVTSTLATPAWENAVESKFLNGTQQFTEATEGPVTFDPQAPADREFVFDEANNPYICLAYTLCTKSGKTYTVRLLAVITPEGFRIDRMEIDHDGK